MARIEDYPFSGDGRSHIGPLIPPFAPLSSENGKLKIDDRYIKPESWNRGVLDAVGLAISRSFKGRAKIVKSHNVAPAALSQKSSRQAIVAA